MMKGIILAGGAGTRLHPITKGVSKQLLPVYDKPMIYYPLSTLMLAGIRDILIITTPEDQPSFKRLLGDGSSFGINLSYAVQEKPNGIAEAFIIGEEFIDGEDVCLVLGDNIFYGPNFTKKLKDARERAENGYATIFGYYVNDPERYGVVNFKKNHDEYPEYIIESIEEKPQNPKTNYAVVGLYFYPGDVVSIAKEIKPSKRGELEITEVNNRYLNYNFNWYDVLVGKLEDIKPDEVKVHMSNYLVLDIFERGFAWLDTGTFDSLSEASTYVETIEKRQGLKIACLEEIAYNNGWITIEDMRKAGEEMQKNNYGQYLLKLASKENAED